MLSTLPLVNTEDNCYINICAVSLLWLTSFPFSFRGATPILSCLLLKKKQSLYNQAKRTKMWSNYRFFQKECRRQIRKEEWNYINNAITEGMKNNNSNSFWKYVKSSKQDNIGVAPLKEKGKLVSHSKETAQILI
jgi:hypothetical protein